MTQQRGANVDIVIGFETEFGTAALVGLQMSVNSIDIKPAQTINTAATLQGSRNPVQPFRGNKDVSGTIVVPVDSEAFWYWFKAMFDDPVTAGGTAAAWQATHDYSSADLVIPTVANGYYYECTTDSGSSAGTEPTWPTTVGATVVDDGITWTCRAFIHEFKVPTTQPSITIEEQFEDLDTAEYFQYLGCKISSFSIDVGGDGELVATIGIVGSDYDIDTSTCFTTSITAVSIDRAANFQAAMTEGGDTLSNATALAISLDMGLDLDTFVIGGGGVRGQIPEGIVGISGTLTTLFEDVALLTKAINGTESAIKLTITDGAKAFELEIQELEYAVTAPAVDGPQGIKQSLSFQGFYANGSEASAIVARLTNATQHA